MTQIFTLTEAKAKLSEIISRVHFGKEKFTITRKGRAVALVLPISETTVDGEKEGLIRARGVLPQDDAVIDELVETIYESRENASDRKVDL